MKTKYQILLTVGVILVILGMGFTMALGVPESITNLTNPHTRLLYIILADLCLFVGGALNGAAIFQQSEVDE